MLQQIVHYSLHFLAIGVIAWIYSPVNWKKNWLILMATMLVDIDHLLASPVFDPQRCGIGFHPLHSEIAILIYFLGIIFVKNYTVRLICIGLLFHMFTDLLDCFWLFSKCSECYYASEIKDYFPGLF